MTDDLQPNRPPTSGAGDHRRAPAAWPVLASMAAIVGALLAMLLVPLQYERRAAPVRARIADVAEPARADITALQLALATGEDLLRDEVETGDGAQLQPYRAAVARVGASTERLRVLADAWQRPAVVAQVDTLRTAVARWERSGPGMLARLSTAQRRARDALHAEHYSEALVAAARLDGVVAEEARQLRTELVAMEASARRWTAVLALFAFAGVAAALWLGLAARRAAHVAERRGWALEAAAESRARFTRGLSHDLKNPLGAIDGHAALLEEEIYGPLGEAQRMSVGRIRAAVRSLLALVDDLVALARAESGELRVELRPTDVRALVRAAADEHHAAATAAGLVLAVQLDDALPELRTDAARVHQVLGNLLSNAVKYTPRGGAVRVTAVGAVGAVGAVTAAAGRPVGVGGGACVRITAADTGPGIPADRREYVFGEFSRLPGTAAPGAGLGLAISRRIARLLGGDLRVESPEAAATGACFVFELPATDGRLAPRADGDRVDAAHP